MAGRWRDLATRFPVTNPTTGALLAEVADCSRQDATEAIAAAQGAQKDWAAHTGKERAALLRHWHDLIVATADDLAAILTAEMGKPLADARAQGANLLTGGARHAAGGAFYTPTVLTGVIAAMRIATEETFGPVAAVFRFGTEAEAVAAANATESGLASYIFTRGISRVWRAMEALEFGIVGVNTGLISTEVAPFGGIKQSGLGREGSQHGDRGLS